VTVAASAPVALDADAATDQDTAVTVSVLDSAFNPAGGTLSVDSVTQGAHGSAAVNADGTVTYTPAAGYAGPDSFQYTVTDGNGNTATGTISLTVGPAPAAPEDAIDSDLAGIETDLENPDDNTADTVSSIWSASISGAMNAYLNSATEFVNAVNLDLTDQDRNFAERNQKLVDDYYELRQHLAGAEILQSVLYQVALSTKNLIESQFRQLKATTDKEQIKSLVASLRTLIPLQKGMRQAVDSVYTSELKINKEIVSIYKDVSVMLPGVPLSPLPAAPAVPNLVDLIPQP